MYKAKRSRSGFAVFDEIQRQEVTNRLDTERDLTAALEASQFVVHYQPLVSVSKRGLYGFEALVRWQHPTRGLLGPAEFLAVAEETGMMGRIGEMVMREACAQAAVWNHLHPAARSVKMSVNIAEQQLLDGNFPNRVREILEWSGLDPAQLQLEIIEDVVIDHLAGLSVLREIRALGVSLAIDDFGTGQSSLSYVKQFDMVSSLKIDKSFVDDMDGASAAVIEAVTTMSKAMNLQVIAEGVETTAQVQQLMGYGIDVMQGYLFSKPVSASQIDPAKWFAPQGSGLRTPAPSSVAAVDSLHQSRPQRRA
ncbi:MAG: EAL domain-containing protein [Acidimicrobiales bacterium]